MPNAMYPIAILLAIASNITTAPTTNNVIANRNNSAFPMNFTEILSFQQMIRFMIPYFLKKSKWEAI